MVVRDPPARSILAADASGARDSCRAGGGLDSHANLVGHPRDRADARAVDEPDLHLDRARGPERVDGDLVFLRRDIPRRWNAAMARLDTELPPDARPLLVGQAAVFHWPPRRLQHGLQSRNDRAACEGKTADEFRRGLERKKPDPRVRGLERDHPASRAGGIRLHGLCRPRAVCRVGRCGRAGTTAQDGAGTGAVRGSSGRPTSTKWSQSLIAALVSWDDAWMDSRS